MNTIDFHPLTKIDPAGILAQAMTDYNMMNNRHFLLEGDDGHDLSAVCIS